MIKTILSVVVISSMIACQSKAENKNSLNPLNNFKMKTNNEQSIETVLKNYFNALNNSSVSQAVLQYTADGVFMPKEAPTSSGTQQLTAAYEHVFGALDFINMGYTIDELTIEGNWAFVRTSSVGNLKILANDALVNGAKHRELFVMKKTNTGWKIARYMFNTTAPVAH